MSILEKLRKDKVQAMKDKDKLRIGVISLMMSSIALAEKEKKKTLEDEEALEFIKRELKQTKDALEQTPTNREDLISETEKKIEIISSYLPEQMSIEELKKEVEKIIKELNLEKNPKNKGVLIKEIMGKFKSKTDGKTVSSVVDELLKSNLVTPTAPGRMTAHMVLRIPMSRTTR